jgi:hypothetical protein
MADEQHTNSPFAQPVAADAADAAPERPDGLPDQFWDERTGIKTDELIKAHGELSSYKADADARAAEVPDSADKYEVRLPAEWEANDDAMWQSSKAFAKQHNLTQAGYEELVSMYLEIETNKSKAVEAAQQQLESAIGGRSRIDALDMWFRSVLGDDVGSQMAQTLWSPTIISAFEKLKAGYGQAAQAAPGNTAQPARPQPRTDGKPASWDQMSPRDQRTWQIEQSMRRHA